MIARLAVEFENYKPVASENYKAPEGLKSFLEETIETLPKIDDKSSVEQKKELKDALDKLDLSRWPESYSGQLKGELAFTVNMIVSSTPRDRLTKLLGQCERVPEAMTTATLNYFNFPESTKIR